MVILWPIYLSIITSTYMFIWSKKEREKRERKSEKKKRERDRENFKR